MSGSELGSRDQFPLGLHKPQPQQQQQQQQLQLQNMRLDYAAAAPPTFHPSPNININGGESPAALPHGLAAEPLKRKRGRPRKYGPDGTMALGLTSSPPPPPPPPPPSAWPDTQPGGPLSPAPPSASASPGSSKKGRGRPRGSLNKNHKRSSGPSSSGFTPHVITVKAGEDLSSKILALSQNGPKNVCILTATGAISNVTLRQPASSGGTVTYEGRFEILSLGGSLFLNENGSQRSRYGGLSVSLSGPDGRVLGGGVAGLLIAASPVQVVLASFLSEGRKEAKSANKMGDVSAPEKVPTAGQSSSPSRGTLSESSGGPGSPLNQSTGACNNINPPQGISGMPWK